MALHSMLHRLEAVRRAERIAGPDWSSRLLEVVHTLEVEAHRRGCTLEMSVRSLEVEVGMSYQAVEVDMRSFRMGSADGCRR